MKRYTIKTDYRQKNFSSNKMTLSVEKMKSNDLVMVRPFVKVYTNTKSLLATYTGTWWVIGRVYQPHSFTFNIPNSVMEKTGYYIIGMDIDNINETNRLYFNHLQLNEGDKKDYHQPEENLPRTDIKFTNNFYVNLYTSNSENYLQVIRPYYNNIDTETLKKSKVTVLAPHLGNEDDLDSPSNLGLEFMNQTDQVIEILR